MRKHTHTQRPAILIRRPRIKFPGARARRWHRDSITTLMMHALSPLFPAGERFFIRSVLAYREQIQDPALLEEIRDFAAQEAAHIGEHMGYNAAVQPHYDLQGMERRMENRLASLSRLLGKLDGVLLDKKRVELAITVGLEHFTAVLGDQLLSNPGALDSADPEFAELWNWHAVEEIEHKAVAFDVYEAMGGTYLERVLTFALMTLSVHISIFINLLLMMYQDREILSLRAWREFIRYHFIKPGMFRKAWWQYLGYFRPGFHPWDHDNRHLIEAFKSSYPRIGTPQTP